MPTLAMAFDIFARDAASPVFAKVGASATAAGLAVKKAALAMSAAADAEANAAGRLRVAEAKLTEVRAKSKVSAGALAKAEEEVGAAQRGHAAAEAKSIRSSEDFALAQTHAGEASKRARPHVDNMTKAIGAFAAVEIGKKMVEQAGAFQQGTNVLVTAAGESAGSLKMIRDGIQNIAVGTGTPLKELTDGMYQVEKAGIRGADGLQVLKAASQGAREEGASLATVTAAMTSVMASYHLSASDSVTVMNELKTAAGESKTTMEAFAGSLSTVLPQASASHISFAQVAGSLASLTQHGTSADEAAQELANTMRNLSGPNMVATREMQQLGISSQDVSAKLGERGVAGTLNYLSQTVLQKMGPSGKILLNTFMQSQDAGQNLTTMLSAMAPETQALAKQFESGAITAGEWRLAVGGLTPEQANLAKQFAVTYNRANGFNTAIKNGLPGTQTYTQAIKAMTGGANGLNTTLQLTGESTAGTTERIAKISAAAQIAGKDVDGWASTQKLFNVQMDMFKQRVVVLGTNIGSALMPKLITMTKTLGSMLDFVQQNRRVLVPLTATVLSVGAAFVVASKGIAAFRKIQEISAVVQTLGGRMQTAGAKMSEFSGGIQRVNRASGSVVSGLGKTVSFLGGPWGAAIGVAVGALVALALQHHEALKQTKAFTDTLTYQAGALDADSKSQIAHQLATEGTYTAAIKAGVSEKAFTDALLAGGPARQAMIDQLQATAQAHYVASDAAGGAASHTDDVGKAAQKAADKLKVLGSSIDDSATSANQQAAAMGESKVATDQAGAATGDYTGKVDQQTSAQDKAKASLQKLIDKFTILKNGALNSSEAAMALTSSYLDLSSSIKSNGSSLSTNTAKGIANRTAIIGSIRSINDKITADFKANASAKGVAKATDIASDALKSNRKRLEDVATKAGLSKTAVKNMIDQYVLTPKQLQTKITQPGMDDAISSTKKLRSAIANIDGRKVKITYSSNAEQFAKAYHLGLTLNSGEHDGSTARGGIAGQRNPGMDKGGILPGFTPVWKGDDVSIPLAEGGIQRMRRGEGVYVSEAMKDPYERARLFAVNKAALRGETLTQFREPGLATGGITRSISTPVDTAGLALPEFGPLTTRIAKTLGNVLGRSLGKKLDAGGGGRTGKALAYARAHEGHPYQFGTLWDCSGLVSALVSIAKGQQPHRMFSTTNFGGAKAEGFTHNKKSNFMVGVNPAPGKSGHMVAQINGHRVEESAGPGLRVDGGARSINDPMFSWRGGLARGGFAVNGVIGDLPWDRISPAGKLYNPALGKVARDSGWFDQGGLASGAGWMPKKTIRPERVLSPQQTETFEKLVAVLEQQSSSAGSRGPLQHVEHQHIGSNVDMELELRKAEFRERQGSF